jgi:hypothetical protein
MRKLKKTENKIENRELQKPKNISYVVAHVYYEYPYIFSENRFDHVTALDVEMKGEIIVSNIEEIENYNKDKGQKNLDKVYNEVYTRMRRRDEYYKINDLKKIYDTENKRIASTFKSMIMDSKLKVFVSYTEASEYRRSILN